MSIVSKMEVQTALQVQLAGTQLAMFNFLHPLVEGVFKSWLGTSMEYRQTTELLPISRPRTSEPLMDDAVRDGNLVRFQSTENAFETIQLRNTPVWETGIEVFEDTGALAGAATGAFAAETELDYGADCWLDIDDDENRVSHSGLLYRSGFWPVEPRSVKVVYYGGETVARLADSNAAAFVKAACLLTHCAAYKQFAMLKGTGATVGGKTSETIGKYSYSTPGDVASAFSAMNFGVPLAAQKIASKAKNYAVFG